MVVMEFPSDSAESVRQRIVASAWVMRHRRIPVIPGSAITSPLNGTSGAWPHTTAPPPG
jgi:hypothetical protein